MGWTTGISYGKTKIYFTPLSTKYGITENIKVNVTPTSYRIDKSRLYPITSGRSQSAKIEY
jgi:hypothetical protein